MVPVTYDYDCEHCGAPCRKTAHAKYKVCSEECRYALRYAADAQYFRDGANRRRKENPENDKQIQARNHQNHKAAHNASSKQYYQDHKDHLYEVATERRHQPEKRAADSATLAAKRGRQATSASLTDQNIADEDIVQTISEAVDALELSGKRRKYTDTEIQTLGTGINHNLPQHLGEITTFYEQGGLYVTNTIQVDTFHKNHHGKPRPVPRLETTPAEQAQLRQFAIQELQGQEGWYYGHSAVEPTRINNLIGKNVDNYDIDWIDIQRTLVEKTTSSNPNAPGKLFIHNMALETVIDNLVVTPGDGRKESDLIVRVYDWDLYERKKPGSLAPKYKSQPDSAMAAQLALWYEYVAGGGELEPEGPILLG